VSIIKRSALVHYSPAEIYALVNDVASYPEFLPWCRSAQVLDSSENEMTASVEIAKGMLNRSFTTHNQLDPPHHIELTLVDGPFKKLQGSWQFSALKTENACKVSLQLEFEFESTMLSLAAGPIFTQIGNSLVDAFCKRAVEVYGERG
jgi:ribosome-associated toxin RatA of RatAB toxin-antitoxin module